MRYLMQKDEYTAMFHSEEDMWWYKGLRDVLVKQLKKAPFKKPHILDAGCGTGMNMHLLQRMGYTVTGIDFSDQALQFCKKRGLRSLKKGSITAIPFKENTFDIVICMDVIGILSQNDVKKAFEEFYRVLKPGGVLLLQTAAYMWLYSQHDVVTSVKKRYTTQGVAELISEKKWQIHKNSYRICFLFPPLAAMKLIKKFFGKNTSQAHTDQYTPPSLVNSLLTGIQYAENKVFEKVNLPFGSSIFLVVEKKV